MADGTGELVRLCLKLPEFEFDTDYRAGIKQQAAVVLSLLQTNGEDKTLIDDEDPVLTILQKIFRCLPQDGANGLEILPRTGGPIDSHYPGGLQDDKSNGQ